MLNCEYYKNEIKNILDVDKQIGYDKINNKICACESLEGCLDCLFNDLDTHDDCEFACIKWLYQPYNPFTFTSKEIAFLQSIAPNERDWVFIEYSSRLLSDKASVNLIIKSENDITLSKTTLTNNIFTNIPQNVQYSITQLLELGGIDDDNND